MTYTVSSGTLNSTIPYHTKVSVLVSRPKKVLTTTLTKLCDNCLALLAVFNRYACCLFTINYSSCTRLAAILGEPGYAEYLNAVILDFIGARTEEVMVIAGAVRCAMLL